MATLTVTTINRSPGITDLVGGGSLVAAAGGGDKFANTGGQFFILNNGGGGSVTLTMVLQATLDGQTATSRTLVVAAGKIGVVGGFPTSIYNDINGFMNFTYSGVVTVTVGPFQVSTS